MRLCFTNIPNTHFNKQLRSGPSPKSCFYFKICKAQSCLTFAQYFDQKIEIWVYSSNFSTRRWHTIYCSQRSKQFLWKKETLRLLIGLIENSLKFWKYFWNNWKIILLFNEDDSPLKVAEQITFRCLVAHTPVAYINKKWTKLEKTLSYERV